jgi:hypothetical protein
MDRLDRDCRALGDPSLTKGITVGIQTSADHLFHLKRIVNEQYHPMTKVRLPDLSQCGLRTPS